jgi:AraC-like DNA-binding protein
MSNKDLHPKVYLYKRIVDAKLFIDTHYADKLELDDIADEACFSKFHFIRLFRTIYGKTPHQYLTDIRIEKAAGLMRAGESVTSSCFAVGFDSVSSFSALFKKNTGSTPSGYLSHWRTINAHIRKAPFDFIPGCFAEKKGWTQKSNFQEVIS